VNFCECAPAVCEHLALCWWIFLALRRRAKEEEEEAAAAAAAGKAKEKFENPLLQKYTGYSPKYKQNMSMINESESF